MKKVSENDIAKALGLSRNTVSKALHGSTIVSHQTRRKVLNKAFEMGYTKLPPDAKTEIGESMLNGAKKIAVISKREVSSFWNRIMFGISDMAEKTDYSFMMHFISDEDEKDLVLPKDIACGNVQGIISLSVFREDYIRKIAETRIPAAFYDTPAKYFSGIPVDAVLVEGYYSMYSMVTRLLQKGRKHFAFIGNTSYCRTVSDRWRGFSDALADAGIFPEKELCEVGRDPLWYYNAPQLEEYLQTLCSRVDAVVCANDDIAMEVIRFFSRKGYSLPGDVEVTGFDDKMNLPEGSLFCTVHVDNEYVGRRLFQMLLERIQNATKNYEFVFLETRLVLPKGEA